MNNDLQNVKSSSGSKRVRKLSDGTIAVELSTVALLQKKRLNYGRSLSGSRR